MSEKVKVSVILTSYNHAKYIREAIDSILAQTFSNFEIVIVDDASTDESWQIISGYSDPRIRAFRNDTNQSGALINQVVSEMDIAEYIAIHHSDDIWEPDKLEKQVAFLDSQPGVGAVFTWAKIINEQGLPFVDEAHFYYNIFNQPNRSRFEWLNYFFYHGNALCHPSMLIRKACYDECGLYRYGLAQLGDLDMWIRLCMKYEIHIMSEKLTRFRIRTNGANSSGARLDTQIRGQFDFLQLYNNYRTVTASEEILQIFPSAQKYFTQKGHDLGFILGMMALDDNASNGLKLFGLGLLFEAINNPDTAQKIKECYSFTSSDFITLTGKHDVFSVGLVPTLWSRLAEKEREMQGFATRIVEKDQISAEKDRVIREKDSQLQEIFHSRAWRLAQQFRLIRLFLFPLESPQTKIVRTLFSIIRRAKNASVNFGIYLNSFQKKGLKEVFLSIVRKLRSVAQSVAAVTMFMLKLKFSDLISASLQKILLTLSIDSKSSEVLPALIKTLGWIKTSKLIGYIVKVDKFMSAADKQVSCSVTQASQLTPASEEAKKKNILFITAEFPSPHHGGGNRVLNFMKYLSVENNIYLCTAYSAEEHEQLLVSLAQYCQKILKLPYGHFVGNQNKIRNWLGETNVDIVHYEWPLSLENYAPDFGKTQIFTYMEAVSLRLFMDIGRIAPLSAAWVEKIEQLAYALWLEIVQASKLNARVAVTTKDAEFFQRLSPFQEYVVLNHGLDFESFELPDVEPEPQTLVFVGNYKHYPNVDAMRYFFDEMWGNILGKIPEARIYVVGIVPPVELQQISNGKNIIVTGEVPDIRLYIQKASVCIAPLVTGAGLRGKVIEYAALRRTFVATSIATTDLIFKDGVDYFCAEKPDDFSQRIISLLENPELARQMAENAYKAARENYDTKKLTGYLLSLYQYLESKSNAA